MSDETTATKLSALHRGRLIQLSRVGDMGILYDAPRDEKLVELGFLTVGDDHPVTETPTVHMTEAGLAAAAELLSRSRDAMQAGAEQVQG